MTDSFLNTVKLVADFTSGLGLPDNNPSSVVSGLLSLAYWAAGIIAIGMIAYSGIKYMLANGNPSKVTEATNSLISAIAGLAIVLLAGSIISFVIGAFGNDDIAAAAQAALRWIFYAAGVIAVIMIVLSGIRFIVAHGDAGQVKAATNTLIYSIAGLAVTLLSYAIFSLVVNVIG